MTTEPTSTVPASMGDRSEFQPRHPNAVPARCDGCPSTARWTYKGSRYCDEHAGLTTAPPRTDRAAAVAPLSDEELTLYGELIDTVPGPGPALSWTAESRLLAEAQRARAALRVLEGQLATAQGQLARVRENQIAWTHGLNDYAERQHQNSDKDRDGYAAIRAAGAAFGAGQILQQLLMELGEVEFDEAAECTWDIVSKWPETARALGLDGGGSDA